MEQPSYDPGYPPEYDEDPVSDAEKIVAECERAILAWETPMGNWEYHIRRLIATVERLSEYIEENC